MSRGMFLEQHRRRAHHDFESARLTKANMSTANYDLAPKMDLGCVLYYVHPLPFRCRTCCDLAYPSQYQSRDRSYCRQLRGLSRREQDRLLAPRAGVA